ncbi:MAG: hypothetical protein ACH34X_19360 [Thiolinea sp.]
MIKGQYGNYHPVQLVIVLGLILMAIAWFSYNYITKDKDIKCADLEVMQLILEDSAQIMPKIKSIYDSNCSANMKEHKIKTTNKEFNEIIEMTTKLSIKAPYVLEKYNQQAVAIKFKQSILDKIKSNEINEVKFEYASLNKKAMDDILLDPKSSFFKIRSKNLSISKEVLPKGLLATYINHCNDTKDDCIRLLKEITEKQNPRKEITAGEIEEITPSALIKKPRINFSYPSDDQCYLFFSKSEVVETNNKCAIPNNNNYYLYLIRENLP